MGTNATSPLRQRMIEDMNARKLCAGTQRSHIYSCKRRRFDWAAGIHTVPSTVTPSAEKWNDIGAEASQRSSSGWSAGGTPS